MQNYKKQYSSQISRKAWNIIRLALLWARKGGVFKRRISFSKLLTTLRHLAHTSADGRPSIGYYYQEREFSFDDSPIFHVKMHRPSTSFPFRFPRIPCIIHPQVDFDYDFNNNDRDDLFYLKNNGEAKLHFLNSKGDEEISIADCEDNDEGIDVKAEEFIAKFYQQIRLQKQISLLSVQ